MLMQTSNKTLATSYISNPNIQNLRLNQKSPASRPDFFGLQFPVQKRIPIILRRVKSFFDRSWRNPTQQINH